VVIGARHPDLAGFQGLAQRVERLGAELGQFIQEQNAVVGQGNFARPGADAAAGEGGHARRVVRRAERPRAGQGAARDQAGDRVDERCLQQLGGGKRRQQPRQALGQHGLP
jgi:hypothetical protein